jgi:hypothetical protein
MLPQFRLRRFAVLTFRRLNAIRATRLVLIRGEGKRARPLRPLHVCWQQRPCSEIKRLLPRPAQRDCEHTFSPLKICECAGALTSSLQHGLPGRAQTFNTASGHRRDPQQAVHATGDFAFNFKAATGSNSKVHASAGKLRPQKFHQPMTRLPIARPGRRHRHDRIIAAIMSANLPRDD